MATMGEGGFAGFPPEAVTFLEELRTHNEKTWFVAHKNEYENSLLEPVRAFAADMADRLTTVVGPEGGGVLGSPFRIYRDVRFSKDKSPYKTYAGVPFGRADRGKGKARDSTSTLTPLP